MNTEKANLGRLDFCIGPKDIIKSHKFYKNMGLKEVEGDLNEKWIVLAHGNLRLGLFEGMWDDRFILNFRGANIIEIEQQLLQKGLAFTKKKVYDDGTGSLTLYDPDGNTIFFDTAKNELNLNQEMCDNPQMFYFDKEDELKLGRTDICLDVENLEKSLKFYLNLGLQEVEGKKEEGWVVVQQANLRLALYQKDPSSNKDNLTINFRGGDVKQIANKLSEMGYQFTTLASESEDGSWGSTLYDPDEFFIFFDTHPSEKGLLDKLTI
ncbi:MAG: VOC family protein [Candidatus Kariarchaeaceae archaeon]